MPGEEFTFRSGDRSVLIRHERVGGFSTFTSPDIPALHITAADASKARAKLGAEIQRILFPKKGARNG